MTDGESIIVEHRLTALETHLGQMETLITEGFESIRSEIKAVSVDLTERVRRLEQWRVKRETEISYEQGVAAGRTGLRRSDLAVLGAFVTAAGVIGGLIPHIWSLFA